MNAKYLQEKNVVYIHIYLMLIIFIHRSYNNQEGKGSHVY